MQTCVAGAEVLREPRAHPLGEGLPVHPHAGLVVVHEIAEVIQQQWKEVLGIRVKLVNQEWKVYLKTVTDLEYDIARGGWIGDYLDPNTYLDMWISGSGNNRTGFASESYDQLIRDAAATLDPRERLRILRRCEEIITREECIILPIYFYVTKHLVKPWVQGYEPNILDHNYSRYLRIDTAARGD